MPVAPPPPVVTTKHVPCRTKCPTPVENHCCIIFHYMSLSIYHLDWTLVSGLGVLQIMLHQKFLCLSVVNKHIFLLGVYFKKWKFQDFLGGPVVKNPPSNAGDTGLIPGWGTKISRATGPLSPHATTTELARLNERACVPQTTEPPCSGVCVLQLQNPCALGPTHHNQREARVPQRRGCAP